MTELRRGVSIGAQGRNNNEDSSNRELAAIERQLVRLDSIAIGAQECREARGASGTGMHVEMGGVKKNSRTSRRVRGSRNLKICVGLRRALSSERWP